jgi:hypothetical protein
MSCAFKCAQSRAKCSWFRVSTVQRTVTEENIGAGKCAIVHDLLDAGSRRGDLLRENCESTGSIADHGGGNRLSYLRRVLREL